MLRKIVMEDVQELFALRSDERVMQYIDRPRAKTIDDAMNLFKIMDDALTNHTAVTWAITMKGAGRLEGTIGFWRIEKENHRAEIGYLLNPALQGKGFMQEAMTAVIDYGFRLMRLHSIEANVNPGNASSKKLLEKNGFVQEAYFRENYFFEGKFLDSVIYSRINEYDSV
ncbi:MAG: GNAT family protein [Bacteroidetes bacterium]|nr:GNAT family protein [Bacteroidota bacterium]